MKYLPGGLKLHNWYVYTLWDVLKILSGGAAFTSIELWAKIPPIIIRIHVSPVSSDNAAKTPVGIREPKNIASVTLLSGIMLKGHGEIMKPAKNSTSGTFILLWYVLHCTEHLFWIGGSETFETIPHQKKMKLGHQTGYSFFHVS